MTKYNFSQIDEHIQWLMRFMQTEYPNNYEIIIGPAFAQIRNVQREMSFMREDISPENICPSKEEIGEVNEKIWDMLRGMFFWKPNQ